VYQLALDRLSLSGAAAVAVEDTAHGVAAAHAQMCWQWLGLKDS
jgi:beta-phosphoglucomutase-like phosphatase (HAD superfamily)